MRDGQGRFTEGNPGGPGRPKRQTEQEYLATLRDVCTLDEWKLVCTRAVTDAKDGDARARQWLSDYIVGKPTPLETTEGETAESFAKGILASVREMVMSTSGNSEMVSDN